MTAVMDARVERTSRRFRLHWPAIAALCTDRRIAAATLDQLEGRDEDWARDEDRRHGIDAIATGRNGYQTRIGTRTQTVGLGEKFKTITIRDREVPRIADGTYLADLHIQTYGDDRHLVQVIIAAYTPALRAHLRDVADDDPRWKPVDEPGQPRCRMLCIDAYQLAALGSLVWHYRGLPIDLPYTGGRPMTNDGATALEPTDTAAPAVRDEMTSKSPRAQAYNELYNLARLTTNTEMVPKPLRGRPDAAFAVMVYGAELGLEPMAAMRSIFLIEGQPTCSAQLMRGLIQSAGHLLAWREVTSERVELYARRRDTGADGVVTWTMDDARQAKLAGKGNWVTYPRAMLAARATSEMARLLFADVMHGIAYTPEEVGAVGPYSAIDVDYDPQVDRATGYAERPVNKVTGEIHDDGVTDVTDAQDAADAEWIAEALEDDDDPAG